MSQKESKGDLQNWAINFIMVRCFITIKYSLGFILESWKLVLCWPADYLPAYVEDQIKLV